MSSVIQFVDIYCLYLFRWADHLQKAQGQHVQELLLQILLYILKSFFYKNYLQLFGLKSY
jgi:hypothetical protein